MVSYFNLLLSRGTLYRVNYYVKLDYIKKTIKILVYKSWQYENNIVKNKPDLRGFSPGYF